MRAVTGMPAVRALTAVTPAMTVVTMVTVVTAVGAAVAMETGSRHRTYKERYEQPSLGHQRRIQRRPLHVIVSSP